MFRALVLGAVQGLTEFLPVSSSAHLVLVPFVLGWPIPGLAFDVAVHVGTTLALVVYFWRDVTGIVTGTVRTIARRADEGDRRHARLALLLLVGSIPAAVVGVAFKEFFEDQFQKPALVALQLLVTAGLLLGGEALYARRRERREIDGVRMSDALTLGAFQALAIIPGISRSGSTIAAGLARGLTREAATRFSFLLGLPALVGAGLVEIPDYPTGASLGRLLGATAVSAVLGFLSIAFLIRFLKTNTLRPFAVYCALAAALGLGAWFQLG